MEDIDEVDRKIIRELQQDARASFKKIGKGIGVSEATVFVRVKKLQEKDVLKGFQAMVDPKSVGQKLTAIILVRALPKSYPVMLKALSKLPEVYEIYDVTGDYYSVLKVRTTDTDQLSKIIDEIGMIEGVASTETLVVLRTLKEEFGIRV